jgi:hypothetical protein
MERIGALRDQARTLYTTYTGRSEVTPNSEADLRIRKIVEKVVQEERDRTAKLSRSTRGSGSDEEEDRWRQWPYSYPPPGYAPPGYAPPGYYQPPPLYYVPAYQAGHHGH